MSDTKISEAALILDRYDAGLLGDGGGGNVDWWQDYMRSELERAHEFYQDQADNLHPQPAELVEQQGVDAHTLWAMAQLAPGEGIEDGVQRIEEALAATGKQQVDPAWSLHDRVEFALRDAGFDFDEASRIALQVDGKQQVGEVQGDARAQFEAWALKRGCSLVRDHHYSGRRYYAYNDVELAFDAWEAALAARQPGAQEPNAYSFKERVYRTAIGHVWTDRLEDKRPDIQSRNVKDVVPLYDIPPAQGIDLEQFRGTITREYANSRALCDMSRILECEHLLALIDGQRDAAPGVGNGD